MISEWIAAASGSDWYMSWSGSGTSRWDIATAIGTILSAIGTVAAVVTALALGRIDRRRADERASGQREEAAYLRSQERQLDLLLTLNARLAISLSNRNSPEQREADIVMRGLLMASPDISFRFAALRRLLGDGGDFGGLPQFETVYPNNAGADAIPLSLQEVSSEIRRVTVP